MKIKKYKKLKWIILLILLLAAIPLLAVAYYRIDPELLSKLSFYMDLANPAMRIVRVNEGLRKEQVAEVVADKLGWGEADKDKFINAHLALATNTKADSEGRYFPKTYIINKDAEPEAVSGTMFTEFSNQISKVKKMKLKTINDATALKVASIIQREAAGKQDMNLISGIIWNRIWSGMKLQVDATLQYAKGSEEDGWWQQVKSEDKKIKSPYNTYLYAGLPPSAIANPGRAAIEAAYNPSKTSCLFYIHDKNRKIHCSRTYEEHKKNIERYLK
ncbi:MAG TPA: endolytic transglycosylase MltG [Candidatus Paceibacterota bacterium]